MASLIRDNKSGCKTIQLNDREGNGKRPKISLGRMPVKDAEFVKAKVQAIIAAKRSQRAIDAETADWIKALEPALADRLAELGLIPRRQLAVDGPTATVMGFVDDYIAKRKDVKHGTQLNYAKTRKYLAKYFGTERRLDSVTQLDAEQFRAWLTDQELQENTVRSHCKFAKLFFGAAVKGELITQNPFRDIKTRLVSRPDRMRFITLEDTDQLLAAAPDAEWRAIIALARYGGLRTPSETLALRWRDIDWERDVMTVRSPKTEHHEGKAFRRVPLFPELRDTLAAAFDHAAVGAEFVITRYRDARQNLRTYFERIITQAGLTPWPRLFQNLRSSRETELARSFPLKAVVEWMGNTQPVAMQHYLAVTADDFHKAATNRTERNERQSSGTAVQNRVQHAAASPEAASHPVPQVMLQSGTAQDDAQKREAVRKRRVPPVGLEPTTN